MLRLFAIAVATFVLIISLVTTVHYARPESNVALFSPWPSAGYCCARKGKDSDCRPEYC